jgi:hypothetical protein
MKLAQGTETILTISDMQSPYQHPDTLDFLAALKKKYKPTKVICIGDSIDGQTMSKYAHHPDLPGPADEYNQAIKFLKQLYELFPVAQEVVSNHNTRYLKRITEAGIPSSFIKSYSEIMQFPPGWSIHEYVEIDGIMFEHGHRLGGLNAARQAIQVNGQSTAFGHLHSNGGITYVANRKQMLFAMCVGCLIDYSQLAFAYARDSKLLPTLGTGVIVNGKPIFEPLFINDDGRWTGRLN